MIIFFFSSLFNDCGQDFAYKCRYEYQPRPYEHARRERFAERRAALNSALKEKLIGENNRGFLELRADDTKVSAELKKLVEAENADRTTIFTNIARRQNSTPEFVGERFAARMAERAPSGIPIQNARGEWNVKP